MHLTSTVVRNCIITGNKAQYGGGVWYGSNGEPRLENCLIYDNEADWGAGVFLINSTTEPVIVDCEIRNNRAAQAGGGIAAAYTPFHLERTVIHDNVSSGTGGGLFCLGIYTGTATGCTIAGNYARAYGGGGIRLRDDAGHPFANHLILRNTIVAGNRSGGAFSTAQDDFPVVLELEDCCVNGNEGGDAFPAGAVDAGGNFALDPLFCDAASWDFHLQAASPCAPGNHPDGRPAGLIGALDVGCAR
jgi:hypothetical protein